MPSRPNTSRSLAPRTRIALALVAVLTLSAWRLPGQAAAQRSNSESEIQTHFAAAQQAQREKDYVTAEREYKSVIALSPSFAEVHMNLGLVYQLQNRFPEAMAEFQRALKLKPALTGANFFLGVDHCKMGEGAKAVPYLKSALKAANQPDIWLWLATAHEISNDFHAEAAAILQALDSWPQDVDLLYLLGHTYQRLGKQEAARLDNGASVSWRKEQFLAQSYAASNEWPSAVIHFQNAITASPDRADLHVELGEVLLHAGRVTQAGQEFERGLRLNPQNLRALVRRGEVDFIRGDSDAALKAWAQAIAIDRAQVERILGLRESGFGDSTLEQLPVAIREKLPPMSAAFQSQNTPAERLAMAFLNEQSGHSSSLSYQGLAPGIVGNGALSNDCSQRRLTQILQRQSFSELPQCGKELSSTPFPVALRFWLVDGLLQAGQYELALHVLDALPMAERNSTEASYWRARCYEKLATVAYLRLYQAGPNSYRWHQLMGDTYAAKGDDGKALEEYRAALALRSALPNLHYSLGHLLWKDLKVPEARVELEAELAINTHHAGALNDLGDTFLLEHQPEKALPYLLRALAADPGNSEIHRDLGTAYSELRDYHKAVEQLKIAIAEDHDGSVHYKLARAYQALGDKENAAREFAVSTALNRESHSKLEKQTERLAAVTNASQE